MFLLPRADISSIGPTIGPNINPIPATSSLPPPPISLPQNPNTLASAHPNAVITAEPQPASAASYSSSMQHPLPVPPGGMVPGMHPSRLAALGGTLPPRPADGVPEGEPVAKRPRIERIEGHFYPVSLSGFMISSGRPRRLIHSWNDLTYRRRIGSACTP